MGSCCSLQRGHGHGHGGDPAAEGIGGAAAVIENAAFHMNTNNSNSDVETRQRTRTASTSERCNRCRTKIQFCTCDVRRNTQSMQNRKLKSVPGKSLRAGGKRKTAETGRTGEGASHNDTAVSKRPPASARCAQCSAIEDLCMCGASETTPPTLVGGVDTGRAGGKGKPSRGSMRASQQHHHHRQQHLLPQKKSRAAKVKRMALSSDDLARTCAGLGLDAAYSDSGGAKVQLAISKILVEETASEAALERFGTSGKIPEELMELATGELLRAVGVTRLGIMIEEGQWEEQEARDGSTEGEVRDA